MILEFDESFKSSINYLISGMLPHENFDNAYFTDIYNGLGRYVKADEMPLEYRVLVNFVSDTMKVFNSISRGKYIKISRDLLETTLASTLEDFLLENGYLFKSWFEQRGLDSNLDIPMNFESATRAVYEEVLNLYDDCFGQAVPSTDSISYLVGFKNEFLRSASTASIAMQMEIMQGKLYYNRKTYKGSKGWMEFMEDFQLEVKKRIDDNNFIEDDILDSEEKGIMYLEQLRKVSAPLANYGIPVIDEKIPMVTNRFSVLTAREGVGKTLMAVYLGSNLINEGKRVVYMTGETSKESIFSLFLSNYIYKQRREHISPQMINNPEQCSEEVNTLITMMAMKLSSSGLLVLKESPYCYDTAYDEFVVDYEKYKMDAIFIDHSMALAPGVKYKDDKSRVDNLAIDVRNFKRRYPVQMFVLSHLSIKALEELAKKGKITDSSPTRASSALSYEADDVFVLTTNEMLDKQHQRALMCTKRRNADKSAIGVIYLGIMFSCGEFYFDPKDQNQGPNSIEVEAAIESNKEFMYDPELDDEEFII